MILQVTGIGSGQVSADVGNASCSTTEASCPFSIRNNTAVTLTATPDAGFLFLGWDSDTGCGGSLTCAFTIDRARTISAAFVPLLFVSNLDISGLDREDPVGSDNLWTVKTDGTDPTPITSNTHNGSLFDIDWSPDGEQIVFISDRNIDGTDTRNLNSVTNVWVINADGTGLTPLTRKTANGVIHDNPIWSPDGSQIVYSAASPLDGTDATPPDSYNIWVMGADGSNQEPYTRITVDGHSAAYPRWSPDGSRIVYASNRAFDGSDSLVLNEGLNLWLMDADGGDHEPLTLYTYASNRQFQAQWTPSGTQIVYNSNSDLNNPETLNANSTTNIWIIGADASSPTPLSRLTANGAGCFDHAVSPDGALVSYYSERRSDGSDSASPTDNRNVWIVGSDATGERAVTAFTSLTANEGATQSSWSADGDQFFFVSSGALNGANADNSSGAENLWRADGAGENLAPVTSYVGPANIRMELPRF